MCIKIFIACTQLDSVLNIKNYLQEILLITSLYSPRLLNSVCWDKKSNSGAFQTAASENQTRSPAVAYTIYLIIVPLLELVML
jgi:hypothetical protein